MVKPWVQCHGKTGMTHRHKDMGIDMLVHQSKAETKP